MFPEGIRDGGVKAQTDRRNAIYRCRSNSSYRLSDCCISDVGESVQTDCRTVIYQFRGLSGPLPVGGASQNKSDCYL